METHIPSDTIPDTPMPTLALQGLSAAPTVSPNEASAIAQAWIDTLASAASSASEPPSTTASNILSLFNPRDAWWRDLLALTWDFRTFGGAKRIGNFLEACLPKAGIHNVRMRDGSAKYETPFPDVAWISAFFDFKVREGKEEGIGFGVVRLVPVPKTGSQQGEVDWKAHCVLTTLEGHASFPEKIAPIRDTNPKHGNWVANRERESAFADADADPNAPPKPYPNGSPQVLIVGSGQSGLGVAARLKALGVSSVVIEKNGRVGDNWRVRYEALCLHAPVWFDHMPYLPFPPTWPMYTPSLKLANWLEFYADALELNVWTSSNITSLKQDPETAKWTVTIDKKGIQRRLVVNHIVFGAGAGSDKPQIPEYPRLNEFKGEMFHSTHYKRASDHTGKKIVVVGSCTSAHDICVDYYQHGIEVTMFQRGSTCVQSSERVWHGLSQAFYPGDNPSSDIGDRVAASFPQYMATGFNRRVTSHIAELDKDLLESLHKVGFRTNLGVGDTGVSLLAANKLGGFYLDNGGSKLVAEGKIKLKSGSKIKSYTPRGLLFEDGTELEADVIVWATGIGSALDNVKRLCEPSVVTQLKPFWGSNKEGELNGVWRDMGPKGMWYMTGSLALCRFHSLHVALQIKAIEEGFFGERYSSEE
ncbi:unnamed protein product [Cyclocybe aegerita]|uniref:FAD/NAD(P)-binding domain-containing protein n=1 Tax=Cyclocybe aegerita TaxID=1973307 RepID=A0A8S0WSX4_CYCAE|nr:unnamed protein product [Cyclocybe aegerita]